MVTSMVTSTLLRRLRNWRDGFPPFPTSICTSHFRHHGSRPPYSGTWSPPAHWSYLNKWIICATTATGSLNTVANERMSAFRSSLPGPSRTRPCDACRRRKSKCVTEPGKAICVLCNFHSQACTYLQAPQPRKRPAHLGATADGPATKRNRTIRTKPGTGVEEYDSLPGPSLLKRTLGLQNKHYPK